MSELTRYDRDDMIGMLPDLGGKWVKYEDAQKRIAELEGRIAEAQKDLRMAALSDDCVLHLSAYLGAISHGLEGGGVCQNCMGEGIDLIQSGKMVIKEKCTSCDGTGRSEGGGDAIVPPESSEASKGVSGE